MISYILKCNPFLSFYKNAVKKKEVIFHKIPPFFCATILVYKNTIIDHNTFIKQHKSLLIEKAKTIENMQFIELVSLYYFDPNPDPNGVSNRCISVHFSAKIARFKVDVKSSKTTILRGL